MGHAGDPNVRTPALDRLAAEGVSFSRAYANCPICTPSRGTLFSGRHAHCGPVSGFFDVYKATAPSTATELRAAGLPHRLLWQVALRHRPRPSARSRARESARPIPAARGTAHPSTIAGAFRTGSALSASTSPFTVNIRGDAAEPTLLEGYQTDALTDWAIDYLQGYEREEPLFMVLSVEPPHFPLQVPERWKRFDPQALEVRPNFVEQPSPAGGLPTPTPWTFREQDNDTRRYLALYYAMIENLDWNMGRLTATLKNCPGLPGPTPLIVYVADHGDFMGSHGLYRPQRASP